MSKAELVQHRLELAAEVPAAGRAEAVCSGHILEKLMQEGKGWASLVIYRSCRWIVFGARFSELIPKNGVESILIIIND